MVSLAFEGEFVIFLGGGLLRFAFCALSSDLLPRPTTPTL